MKTLENPSMAWRAMRPRTASSRESGRRQRCSGTVLQAMVASRGSDVRNENRRSNLRKGARTAFERVARTAAAIVAGHHGRWQHVYAQLERAKTVAVGLQWIILDTDHKGLMPRVSTTERCASSSSAHFDVEYLSAIQSSMHSSTLPHASLYLSTMVG